MEYPFEHPQLWLSDFETSAPVIGSIKSKSYSPGSVTGILGYIMSFLVIIYLIISNHLLAIPLMIIYALLGMLYEMWNLYKNRL